MAGDTSEAIREFQGLLGERPLRPRAIAAALDAMGHDARVAAVCSLGRGAQRALYLAVEGFRPVRLGDLVPSATGDFVPVRHFGRNTLPVFTRFEKRFCRPTGRDREKPGELYGYNHQTLQPITGPGYFTAIEDPGRPEVLIDYRRLPSAHPDGWPAIRSNERGLGRLVYGFMVDTLRGVSEHVSIGSAAKGGRDLGSWFALCREA